MVPAVLMTQSRNAIASLVLAVPWVVGPAQWWWLLPVFAVVAAPLLLASLPGVPSSLQQWAQVLLPDSVRQRLLDNQSKQSLTRLAQWQFGLQLIADRPWFGWGAAAFSVLYPIHAQRKWHGHSHNLPLELSVSHGLPVALLVVGTVLVLVLVALRRGMLRAGPMDRAWWSAVVVLVTMHATDLPFFDSRLNILGWVLLAGLCAFNREREPDRGETSISPESTVL
jgi:O-antigen ligase